MVPSASDPGDDRPRPAARPEVPPPPPPRTGQTAAVRAVGVAPDGAPGPRSGSAGAVGGDARGIGGAAGGSGAVGGGGAADGGGSDEAAPVGRRAAWARHRAEAGVRPPLRHRILPRSAIGISVAILFFALGASLSGVVLYSYYEYRLTQNEDRVSTFTNGLPAQFNKASDALKAQTAAAQNLINLQLAPLKSVLATGETVQSLAAKVAPALYFVHTLDAAGQPSVGTAFAVASDNRQTLLLTSYTVVQAATRSPGPQVFVRHGGADQALSVYTWDEAKDLALLILPTGSQPTIFFAPAAPQDGERVFAVSALGAQGASITQGFVADVSADGIQHDAATGSQFQGGPLLNSDGLAVGILSRTYAPLGFPVTDVWFAVPPAAACTKVLSCPSSTGPSTAATPGAAGA